MRIHSILFFVFMTLVSQIGYTQTFSELLQAQIFETSNQLSTLEDHLSPNRNNIIVLFSWDCPECIETIESWKSEYNQWRATYSIRITLLDVTGAYRSRQAFEQYEESQLPFEYVIGKNIPDHFYQPDDRLSCYYLSLNFNEEAIHQTATIDGMEYLLNELFPPVTTSTMFSGNFYQTIFNGISCDTAHTDQLTALSDTLINGINYEKVRYQETTHFLRADSMGVYRLIYPSASEITVADFSLVVCDTFDLIFENGKRVTARLEEKYYMDAVAHYVTNIPIELCNSGVDNYLTFIDGIGSNAGFIYDWSGEAITSHLLCYVDDNQFKYRNEIYGGECSVDYSSTDNHSILEGQIEIYPNPSLGQLYVNHDIDFEYSIIDLSGKTWLQAELKAGISAISIEGLSPGAYLFLASNHTSSYTELIIKE